MGTREAPRVEREASDEPQALCASPGYGYALALVAFRDDVVAYTGAMTERVVAASRDGERTIRAECATLPGLLLEAPVDFARPPAGDLREMVERTYALLGKLHARLGRPMVDAVADAAMRGLKADELDPDEVHGRGDVLREAIFHAAESAYPFQYAAFAPLECGRDDARPRDRTGFGVAEAHAFAKAACDLPGRKLATLAAGFPGRADRDWDVLAGFVLSVDEVAAASGVGIGTARAVLDPFAAPAGPCNAGFTPLGDFDVATARPLLRVDGDRYASLQAYCLLKAPYESPFHRMAADAGYRDAASAHRGTFMEELVASRLASVFGASNVHRGVKVLRGSRHVTDVDVLVTFADRAPVPQCNSKRLTSEAREGNDMRSRDDPAKSLQQAYDQALVSAEALGDPLPRFALADGSGLDVRPPRLACPMCAVSDAHPALAAQVRHLLRASTSEGVRPPFATDVFMIDVMAEVSETPLRILSYLDGRIEPDDRVSANGELAFLGHHLSNNLWIDPGCSLIMIADGCSAGLDAAMAVRREGLAGRRTPRGVLDRFFEGRVGSLLTKLERASDPASPDFGTLLPAMSGAATARFERQLERAVRMARVDGRTHDFTMGFEDGSAGLTVHCGPADAEEARATLRRHFDARKHVQRAGEWHGLFVRSSDGSPEAAPVLRRPWRRDAALDAEAAGMTTLSRGAIPRRGRQGRTEPDMPLWQRAQAREALPAAETGTRRRPERPLRVPRSPRRPDRARVASEPRRETSQRGRS